MNTGFFKPPACSLTKQNQSKMDLKGFSGGEGIERRGRGGR